MKEDKKEKILMRYPVADGVADMIGLIPTDPLGSYTGRPEDPTEEPVQDADDL